MSEAGVYSEVDSATVDLLRRYDFDEATFERLRDRLRRGEASPEDNRIHGRIEPPAKEQVSPLPQRGSREHQRLSEIGRAAIREGAVGCVVLAGGMATRFGGVVKACVEALPGQSFLQLKLEQIGRAAADAGGTVPAYVMTSFATDAEIREAVRQHDRPELPVVAFPQMISLRLTEDGELFRNAADEPSPYAPGHGDLTFALRNSGLLQRFRDGGGRVLYMSNVDNLGATLEPAVIGAHLESTAAMTAEVAPKEPGDAGGAPAQVDGQLQIVESFRFPEDFDQDRIPVFNVNSFTLDAAAIDRDFDLTWFLVRKKVEGRTAIQFERLVGQVSAFVPTHYLEVPREGVDGRFLPIKDPADLERRADAIRELMQARGVL